MNKLIAIACAAGLLAACNQGAVNAVTTDIGKVNNSLNVACTAAMTLAPLAGPLISPYILAGCGTAEGLSKLASDPNSVAWVQNLIVDVRNVVSHAKATVKTAS